MYGVGGVLLPVPGSWDGDLELFDDMDWSSSYGQAYEPHDPTVILLDFDGLMIICELYTDLLTYYLTRSALYRIITRRLLLLLYLVLPDSVTRKKLSDLS